MQQTAQAAKRTEAVRLQPAASQSVVHDAMRAAEPNRSRVTSAIRVALRTVLGWLTQPVGRRAREERLAGLSDRTLQDLDLRRGDAQAASWGEVPLDDVAPDRPQGGPLVVCDRQQRPLTLVRLSKAA